jgi:hypothetical protein
VREGERNKESKSIKEFFMTTAVRTSNSTRKASLFALVMSASQVERKREREKGGGARGKGGK